MIAIRHKTFKTIQVKTTARKKYSIAKLPESYDLLAVVHLVGEDSHAYLDRSSIFLIPKTLVGKDLVHISKLKDFILCEENIEKLFGNRHLSDYGTFA